MQTTPVAIISMPSLFSPSNDPDDVLSQLGGGSDSDFDEFFDCEEGGLGLLSPARESSPSPSSTPLLQFRDMLLHRSRR